MFRVVIEDVLADEDSPVLKLRLKDRDYNFEMWIGEFEANAIAEALSGAYASAPRPLTHDTMANIILRLRAILEKVIITNLVDDIFYSVVVLKRIGDGFGPISLDSRPSDAIAVALRLGAPIFVDSLVLEKLGCDCKWLKVNRKHESIKPEDFM